MIENIILYFKSFIKYFPTWIICIFFLLCNEPICLTVGILLLILQTVQIYFNRKRYVLRCESEEISKEIIKNFEVAKSKLDDTISKKNEEIILLKEKIKEISDNKKQQIEDGIELQKQEYLNTIKNLEKRIELLTEEKEVIRMRGEFIGYAGHYRVGNDIDTGSYLLVPHKSKQGCVELYPSYSKFKKEEDTIIYFTFDEEYRIAIPENGTYLVIEDADIYKPLPISKVDIRSDFLNSYDVPIFEED